MSLKHSKGAPLGSIRYNYKEKNEWLWAIESGQSGFKEHEGANTLAEKFFLKQPPFGLSMNAKCLRKNERISMSIEL